LLNDKDNREFIKQSLLAAGQAIKKSQLKDPLQFFRGQKNDGPELEKVVKHAVKLIRPIASMYLAFPARSSAAERGFTYATSTVTKLRANISDDKGINYYSRLS